MRHLETRRIVVATHNKGKLLEIDELIGPFGFEAKSAGDYGLPVPPETGTTFEENAYLKASAAATATGLPALSDDSGLIVDAIDGQPGIYAADWAEQPDGTRDFSIAMERVEKLLRERGAESPAERTARFVCVLCLCWPDGHAEYFRGEVEGHMVWPPRGEMGFGYDPVFQPDGYDVTFGEMPSSEKHGWEAGRGDLGLSHRARAFATFATTKLGAE